MLLYMRPLLKAHLLASLSLVVTAYSQSHTNDIKEFNFKTPAVIKPTSITELQTIIAQADKTGASIAIVGADKSMGGQTSSNSTNIVRISTKKYNNLIALDVDKREVTVQPGMTWRELQIIIAPYRLAVRAMQSYHDFSIGGSLSVNVHGQDIHDAPMITSIKSFKILCADGTIRTASREENQELFNAAIGGYGLFGIIVQITLSLTDDTILERHTAMIDACDLGDFLHKNILSNDQVTFYSARYSLSDDLFLNKVLVLYYTNTGKPASKTFKPITVSQGILPRIILALTKIFNKIKQWRFYFETRYFSAPASVSRNDFLNHSIKGLPQFGKYILQEYFIPYDRLNDFINQMKHILVHHSVNILNVSARHVPRDTESTLAYAPTDRCALVLYIHIPDNTQGYTACGNWTRKLIDEALACDGSYYLPYHLLGSDEQIIKAYPTLPAFLKLKELYDPTQMFSNRLYERYKHLAAI